MGNVLLAVIVVSLGTAVALWGWDLVRQPPWKRGKVASKRRRQSGIAGTVLLGIALVCLFAIGLVE